MNAEVTVQGATYALDTLEKHLIAGQWPDGSNIPVEASIIGVQLCAHLRWAQADAETTSQLHTDALARLYTLEAA